MTTASRDSDEHFTLVVGSRVSVRRLLRPLSLSSHNKPGCPALASQRRNEHGSSRRNLKCGSERKQLKQKKLEIVGNTAKPQHCRHHIVAVDQLHFGDEFRIHLVTSRL